ncbi:MAG: pyrroline-5-carboxylate reductase [Kiloniellales bacterium]|jgi:pyrroline-5-carboxylate reductase
MTIGFIGTGNIASALVRGLCASARPPSRILVSPRNTEKAARLAAEFAQVRVAATNQAVVDESDTVILSVLPQAAEKILGALAFRTGQRIVSLIAMTPLDLTRRLVSPAASVVRAVPLPSAARGLGPIALYPGDADAIELLGRLGTPVPAESERNFEVLWATTALIAPYFALLEEVCGWAEGGGVEAATARAYVAAMFHAISVLAVEERDAALGELRAEAATPGGLNKQALSEIRERGGYRAFASALDSILCRLEKG